MAHHYSKAPKPEGESELMKQLRGETERLGLGATGAYPEGIVNDLDEGAIQFGISSDPEREKVFLNFGKSIEFVGMTPQQAIELAQCLIKHARSVSKEPVRVVF